MNRANILVAASLIVTSIVCTGCLAVAAAGGAAGGVMYAKGDLETNLDASVDQVAQAAKAAVEELGLTVLSSHASSLDGEIIARTAQDKKVTIKVRKVTDTTSHISIRVSVFGDQAMSQTILDKIKARL
ncbi:MAG: DUF3568 domain-containing protein [Phycisphaerales bacterium]|nr:DUF3568 domain-containing protein [Phycisphaerales bacterium]MCI0631732.1 DUF3568 domain-containing protein [Phycisphaerales bacterium]